MSTAPTNAEVSAVDTQSRWPLQILIGSALKWLILASVLGLIATIQLRSPSFLQSCSILTHGRVTALAETAFIYGWAGNAGLAIALWILARLGGEQLRGRNWIIVGTLFWNLGVTVGLIGIAAGDMTSFSLLQLPRYVQPLLAFAWAAISVSGILAWNGRRTDSTFASQWYAVAALFLFPWLLCAAQTTLLWMPVRGVVQAIAAHWYAQGAFSLWLAPIALAGAYYVIPKVQGRALPAYEFAPLGFWVLIFAGSWTGGRHLVGGPVPAWVPALSLAATAIVLVHYLIVALNLRPVLGGGGTSLKFIRFGLVCYLLTGLGDMITSFHGVAVTTQFTLFPVAQSTLAFYGAVSLIFMGVIYYMIPRLTGKPWASSGMVTSHRVLVKLGVLGLILTYAVAGMTQGKSLLDPKIPVADILGQIGLPILLAVVAQFVLIVASLIFWVNFMRTACCFCSVAAPATSPFRQPSTMEAPAS